MDTYYNTTGREINSEKKHVNEFGRGLKQGIPIALGYIPVSFTFGLMAVNGGIPVWIAVLISLTNLTSAGQFAGAGLIIADATLFEITMTTFVINIRYMLMSLSISQKVKSRMPMPQKSVMAFGITDEIFAVASLEKNELSFSYMMGLIACPYLGWAAGTLLGAVTTSILPGSLQSSMGIALYAMFIALVVPASKKSKSAFTVVILAVFMSSLFKWMPWLSRISSGWGIIIATVIAAVAGAIFFPRKEEEL